jgi:3-oxoacyl-[acyl-carrier-protein] synthase II
VRRRVYLRGVGAFSPLGSSWPATAARLAAGESGITRITAFDPSGFPCTHAASIAEDRVPAELLGPSGHEDRRLGFARHAAREAWAMAGTSVAPARLGVFLGAESGRGRFSTVLGLSRAARVDGKFDHARFGEHARAFAERIDASVISPSAVAAALAGDHGAGGPVETISLACASGSAAIVEAARAIRLGQIDVALCGGVGADVDPLMLAGFGLLGILSPRGMSCPFDAQRDGFIIGEGAAMLVLSADPGTGTYADGTPIVELAGIGRSLDAHHLTAPDPEGDGAYRAMTAALRDAGLAIEHGALAAGQAVDYVQAHGTSTPLNDAIEVVAIKRALGPTVGSAHVSSSKGALGHWVAGAGALGALFAWESIVHQRVLPTAGLADPDPRCDVHHVMGSALAKPVRTALANAFAFGGANSCLVLRALA